MSTSVQALLVAVVAAAVGVGVLVRSARLAGTTSRGATVGSEALATSVAAAIVTWGAGLVLGPGSRGLPFFDLLSYLYLAVVLTAPAVAFAALLVHLAARRGRGVAGIPLAATCAAAALLLLAPLGIWMSRIETRRLRVDEQHVAFADHVDGDDPVRVGVIADIQTVAVGAHEERAVTMLLEQDPDVVLIAGDLFQGTAGQFRATHDRYRRLLRRLDSVPGGAFVVGGDADEPGSIETLIDGTGVTLLDGAVAEVQVGDRTLEVLGVPLLPDDRAVRALDRLAASRGGTARILLAHRPDWAERFGDGPAGVDLVVSGHTHGGQVQLPGFGPLLTLTHIPRHMAAGGISDLDGQLIYVSTGVGMEQQGAPQIRLGARPSVGIVVLR